MNFRGALRKIFRAALELAIADKVFDLRADEISELLSGVIQTHDERFGDYTATFAMSLAKRLALPPRRVAAEVIKRLDVTGLFDPPGDPVGPGFINLRVSDAALESAVARAVGDSRMGVAAVEQKLRIVLDYSSPNVAKPMHVGHIRSTVIGDALHRILRFRGHETITDNHLGDWGTQFGMILWGWKHFRNEQAFESNPTVELGRLYRMVRKLVDASTAVRELPHTLAAIEKVAAALAELPPDARETSREESKRPALNREHAVLSEASSQWKKTIVDVESDPVLARIVRDHQHEHIDQQVLAETAKLHRGDPESVSLWESFMPACRREIERVYERLDVTFDHTLGESFYHGMLPGVVSDLLEKGLAQESRGAICVFLDGFESPFVVRKADGAFLYSTTDLATIQWRMEHWKPNRILYVVDHRQGLHFQQLFATARAWGFDAIDLRHVEFGTVLGDDGRPFKTRSGDTVGLESLLDEAVRRAAAVVANGDPNKSGFSQEEQSRIAHAVGIGAIKYADLSQNRTSDYVFSFDKMLQLSGNTAAYMQYAVARVEGIFQKGEIDRTLLRSETQSVRLADPLERRLAMGLLRFSEILEGVEADSRPSGLSTWLFDTAGRFSTFYDALSVLKAEENERPHRLALCDLTGRILRSGLELLGIRVVDKM